MALLAAPSDPKDPDYYPFPKFPKQQGSTKEPTLAERAEIVSPITTPSPYSAPPRRRRRRRRAGRRQLARELTVVVGFAGGPLRG